jgi:hypothetical protein
VTLEFELQYRSSILPKNFHFNIEVYPDHQYPSLNFDIKGVLVFNFEVFYIEVVVLQYRSFELQYRGDLGKDPDASVAEDCQ